MALKWRLKLRRKMIQRRSKGEQRRIGFSSNYKVKGISRNQRSPRLLDSISIKVSRS